MAVKLANYSEPALNRYLHNRARVHGVPLSGNFELTPCCNLQCPAPMGTKHILPGDRRRGLVIFCSLYLMKK